ncbi:uncharacterized protein FFMR_15865 [Fusarium fujikuroi]|nr:uncharacterized protein FFMR_15865 [Fusarium fujikuroi]
MPYKKPA